MFVKKLGNIQTCFRPRRIINPYTHELMYVPCRSCPACLNKCSLEWQNRISDECKLHRYSMFLTLTYNNANLPVYYPVYSIEDRSISFWSSNRPDEFSNIIEHDNPAFDFVPITHDNRECVPYASRTDITKFFKRFRSHISYYFNKHHINETSKIRYFYCSEYGSKFKRPHFHAIIWFESETLCRLFGTFLAKSWTYGTCDFSLVNSSAPSYVAKYLNGNLSLPPILQTKFTKPFHNSSKKPCIGFDTYHEEKLSENLRDGTFGYTKFDKDTKLYIHVPTARQTESRYIPKCRGYRSISYFEKLRIYEAAFNLYKQGIDNISECLHGMFESSVDIHATLACLRWCLDYNITPRSYLNQLIDYYKNKDYFNLLLQFQYQFTYVNELNQPVHHLLDFDPIIYERLPHSLDVFLSSSLRLTFSSYGVTSDMLYTDGIIDGFKVESLKQCHSEFYINNCNEHIKISNDCLKTKNKNELLNPLIFT